MSVVSRLQKAAARLIGIAGQTVTYKRGVSTMTVTGRVGVLDAARKYEWFTSAETSGWDAPAFVLVVAGDFQPFASEPTVSDFVLLNNFAGVSVQYDVKRWDKQRIGGACLKTVLFLEKH